MKNNLLPSHGGYRNLKSYQMAVIVHDLTDVFCKQYKSYLTYKLIEQMIGAARSGKQNIAEGSIDSATSKKVEIKLINIARGSQEELLIDYEDFLRQNKFDLWSKDHPQSVAVRRLAYRSYKTYRTYIKFMDHPESAANTIICLIHQTNYLLDKQIKSLETEYLEKGGFTERMYHARKKNRSY